MWLKLQYMWLKLQHMWLKLQYMWLKLRPSVKVSISAIVKLNPSSSPS